MSVRILAITLIVAAVVFGVASRANAQGEAHDLRVVDVTLTEVGETKASVKYEVRVDATNEGSNDFDGVARVDYQVDGGISEIVYVITDLDAGASIFFTFMLELGPGDHQLGIVLDDAVHETKVHVSSADLTVNVVGERVVTGGMVELDLEVTNRGDRHALGIGFTGAWEDATSGKVGEATLTTDIDSLEPGSSGTATASFEIAPGSYVLLVGVLTATVATNEQDDTIKVAYDVEFVELDVSLSSAESLRWISGESALMEIGLQISNRGVDSTPGVEIGFECGDGTCSGSKMSGAIAAGESIDTSLQVWMPIGDAFGNLYAGANEQTFRWGDRNSLAALIEVPESPPLEWSLAGVSDAQEIRYWSDGSANAVFETTLRNDGSDLVWGDIPITVECVQHETVVEGCGGEFELAVDPTSQSNVLNQIVRVPQGETVLVFARGDQDPVVTTANVPRRILGVDREIWDCFSDTSNSGKNTPRDVGIGCGGWRNEYVVKWEVGEPIRLWTAGDAHYEEILSSVIDDLAPMLGIEFETARSRHTADIVAYLGLPREGTKLEGLNCNHAAGCAAFDINSDGTIGSARIVAWPPSTSLDERGVDHMIYSVVLHELLHVLTGMLHRHQDRTSVMSYDSLDYTTLSETDLALMRISSHPLVEPKMRFHEVRELIVFEDELVDPPGDREISVRQVLRRAHAKLMDSGSARYEINGGWPGCNLRFGKSAYEFGELRPRAPRWVHYKDELNDFYMIRSTSREVPLQFWIEFVGRWRLIPGNVVQQAVSFRDSFSNPLGMLSSINIYALDDDLEVISQEDGRMVLQVSMEGADVRAGWSRKTLLDVEMEIDVEEFTIDRYEMTWTLDPEEANVCKDYHVEAELVDYGAKFELPEVIQNRQPRSN